MDFVQSMDCPAQKLRKLWMSVEACGLAGISNNDMHVVDYILNSYIVA